jgi:hypothetical protein
MRAARIDAEALADGTRQRRLAKGVVRSALAPCAVTLRTIPPDRFSRLSASHHSAASPAS